MAVCVDYTNLNNACLKDSFPLPRIDQIVDSTTGQGMLSFLDAFSGYHQIPMSSADEEKTVFITPHGLYCYKVMPFRLKNVDATYQRLMTKIFKPLNSYSTSRYPQSNGQAEATNKTLIIALKKRLEQAKEKWVEELPDVLWAYRTTPGRPIGNTHFALAYGMNAIIPTEIGLPTIRTEAERQDDANAELGRNLDWADEVRETASIRMADYQQRASGHYNRKVRSRSFKNSTLVLRKVFENTVETGAGKFQVNWEGPYIVSKASESGVYHLQKLDGTPLLRPWNVSNLK
ncbi:Transposon Ty3-I Gag-Pol polyprotein [Vitis vinifera]|uniref:Transposon Ty3-I Gag-Pol polyprotein n=1 Tax=Vitis vinifera TaxID=29760 RepID=A0A438K2D6_VITVI|nr:Transposon Ty3-I Gag-Pol polyprotein [Vitis vinifera]